MAVSELYAAAYALVALEDEPVSIADRQFAVDRLRAAVAAEGEPSAPEIVTGDDGSVTTTWWDGTFEVVDGDGTIVTPRGKPAPARAPRLAPDEIYDPETGRVFKTVDVEPAGTTQASS